MAAPLKNRRIEWIFFDIGDVIANEDRLRFNLYRLLEKNLIAQGIDLSFAELVQTREDLILGHADDAPHYSIAKMYLSKKAYNAWHQEVKHYIHRHLTRDLILVPGIDSVLRKLSKQYKLGIIADQPHEILDFLKKHRVADCFKVMAISGIINLNKPRKKIFEWAVNHAGCSFGKTVMIGDRIDRDIVPAKQLDMITVQAKWPTHRKGFEPKTAKQRLYLDSLHRIKNWQVEPKSASECAVAVVERVRQIPEIIQKLG